MSGSDTPGLPPSTVTVGRLRSVVTDLATAAFTSVPSPFSGSDGTPSQLVQSAQQVFGASASSLRNAFVNMASPMVLASSTPQLDSGRYEAPAETPPLFESTPSDSQLTPGGVAHEVAAADGFDSGEIVISGQPAAGILNVANNTTFNGGAINPSSTPTVGGFVHQDPPRLPAPQSVRQPPSASVARRHEDALEEHSLYAAQLVTGLTAQLGQQQSSTNDLPVAAAPVRSLPGVLSPERRVQIVQSVDQSGQSRPPRQNDQRTDY